MNCPHCSKEMKVPEKAVIHVEAYGDIALVVTECCDKPVRLIPVRSYYAQAYTGYKDTDDWGTPIDGIN